MTLDSSLIVGDREFFNPGQHRPQESSQGTQSLGLHGLNNHGALRNLNAESPLQSPSPNPSNRGVNTYGNSIGSGDIQTNRRGFDGDRRPSAHRIGGRFTPTRQPNEQSLSPTRRTSAGGSWTGEPRRPLPSQSNRGGGQNGQTTDQFIHHEMNEDLSERGLYACPLGTQSHRTFEEMSNEARLDLESHAIALMHAQVFGDNNRYLSQTISQARILMEVSALQNQLQSITNSIGTISEIVQAIAANPQLQSQPNLSVNHPQADEPWKPSDKLLDIMNPLALRLMESPELQAYTALSNPSEGYLPHSLFNTIKLNIAKEGPQFISKYLPPQHLGVEEASSTQKYYTAIRDSAKRAREKVHNVLLAGIHVPTKGDHILIPVPNLMDLVQRVRVKCGSVGPNCGAKAVWEVTDLTKRARIAYLRREAARIVLKGGRGSESIWGCVDNQLSQLRMTRDEDYIIAFYNIVCEDDQKYFDGRTFLQELKDQNIDFNTPSHEAIQARMPGGGQIGHNSAGGSGNMHEG
ncbi:hypothetical protein DFH28DRAFT_1135359 [Melampsora americana]|nr:hypothetical protein DFH28DRAFT_1135359 [Melampsora americana]